MGKARQHCAAWGKKEERKEQKGKETAPPPPCGSYRLEMGCALPQQVPVPWSRNDRVRKWRGRGALGVWNC